MALSIQSLATALLFQDRDINIFMIKRHAYASISLIIKSLGFSSVWMKSNLVLICGHGFDTFLCYKFLRPGRFGMVCCGFEDIWMIWGIHSRL